MISGEVGRRVWLHSVAGAPVTVVVFVLADYCGAAQSLDVVSRHLGGCGASSLGVTLASVLGAQRLVADGGASGDAADSPCFHPITTLSVTVGVLHDALMGIMRKITSISTVGLVSYRGKAERAGRYSKQTRNAARAQVAQNAAQLEMQRQQLTAMDHGNVREEVRDTRAFAPVAPIMPPQPVPVVQGGPPPGWYPDVADAELVRWYDGVQWTDFTRSRE